MAQIAFQRHEPVREQIRLQDGDQAALDLSSGALIRPLTFSATLSGKRYMDVFGAYVYDVRLVIENGLFWRATVYRRDSAKITARRNYMYNMLGEAIDYLQREAASRGSAR